MMRLVSFDHDGRNSFGCIVGPKVLDLGRLSSAESEPESEHDGPGTLGTMEAFFRSGNSAFEWATGLNSQAIAQENGLEPYLYPLTATSILAPLSHPSKIIAVGRNYSDHADEAALELPAVPRIFPKWSSSLLGPGGSIIRPRSTQQLDWEVELAVIIGERASKVTSEEAMHYVAGYTLLNDVTARDIQFSKPEQLALGKNFRTFAPMGAWIVTKDEVSSDQDLDLRLWVNDELMQQANSRDLIFSIPRIISFLSHAFDLEPADVISTGTPAGVGYFRRPQVFLQVGDTVRLELSREGVQLCELVNDVVAEALE